SPGRCERRGGVRRLPVLQSLAALTRGSSAAQDRRAEALFPLGPATCRSLRRSSWLWHTWCETGSLHMRRNNRSREIEMSLTRRSVLGGAALMAALAAGAGAGSAQDTIKVGVLHSLSGTMAISETTLKDVMLMLIEEQNKKG